MQLLKWMKLHMPYLFAEVEKDEDILYTVE